MARFNWTSDAACQTRAVDFDASASFAPRGRIAWYAWDFGDGTTDSGSDLARPVHTYATSGPLTARLGVTGPDGQVAFAQRDVQVPACPLQGPPAPEASTASANAVPMSAPETDLSFAAQAEGPLALRFASNRTSGSFAWDFGDGSPASAEASPVHLYAAPGTYAVRLGFTDRSGHTQWAHRSVAVQGVAALASAPRPVQARSGGLGLAALPSLLAALAVAAALLVLLVVGWRRRKEKNRPQIRGEPQRPLPEGG